MLDLCNKPLKKLNLEMKETFTFEEMFLIWKEINFLSCKMDKEEMIYSDYEGFFK